MAAQEAVVYRLALRALRSELSPAVAEAALEEALKGADEGQPFPTSPERRNDLWHTTKMFDYGLEGNLEQWKGAVEFLGGLMDMGDRLGNDAVSVALVDARDRANEEVKRAQLELTMRREWAAKQPKEADLL